MTYDVVIVGAGSAGAAAAAFCAERGLRTVCVEARPLSEAGARWVNDIPAHLFDEAGVERPSGAELLSEGHDGHMVGGWGPHKLRVRRPDVLVLDMRRLVERLQARARAAGALLVGEAKAGAFDGRALETSAGRFEARWFVDAAGVAGPRLLEQPVPPRRDLCVAGSFVHRVRDAGAMRAFFARFDADPADMLNFTGVAGGFSTLSLRAIGDAVQVMGGSVPADGQAPGPELVRAFVEREGWIGERLWGASRAIPLCRAYPRLASGTVALLGDAACQAFPAHASGVGAGMVAARMLAEALASGAGPQGYAVRWQRSHGALHAAYEVFLRFSRTLSAEDEGRMFRSGLAPEPIVRAAVEQRWPPADVFAFASLGPAAARAPRLAARFLPYASRMAAVAAHHALYPEDPARVDAWAKVLARLAGTPPRELRRAA